MTRKPKSRVDREGGFSALEIMSVVAVIAIISAIAIPIYRSQRSKTDLQVAQLQGQTIADEVSSMLSSYLTLGTSSPATNTTFITLTSGTTLTVNPAAGAVGGSAGALTNTVRTPGVTITSSGFVAASPTWCFVADYNGQKALFTPDGYQYGKTTCAAAGTFS